MTLQWARWLQITGVSIVCSTVCLDANHRKHQISASLAYVNGIHWSPENSPHKGPVTPKMFPIGNAIIMPLISRLWSYLQSITLLICLLTIQNECLVHFSEMFPFLVDARFVLSTLFCAMITSIENPYKFHSMVSRSMAWFYAEFCWILLN